MKVHTLWAELLHVDGRTDGEREMTQLIFSFRNCAKTLKVLKGFPDHCSTYRNLRVAVVVFGYVTFNLLKPSGFFKYHQV